MPIYKAKSKLLQDIYGMTASNWIAYDGDEF